MHPIICPSILAADFANLQRDIEMINNSDADWFHIDIMDGVFVPNISFGFPVLKTIQKHAKKPLDVHLMIVDPDRYTQAFKDTTVHNIPVVKKTVVFILIHLIGFLSLKYIALKRGSYL